MKQKTSNKRKRGLKFEAVEQRDPPTNLFPVDFDEGNASEFVTNYYSYGEEDTIGGNDDDSVGGGGGGG